MVETNDWRRSFILFWIEWFDHDLELRRTEICQSIYVVYDRNDEWNQIHDAIYARYD